ncbi:hypothetical protein HK103_004674 [Boothiomyces macroporosus]|uniref:Uncharacterized protein n=1 Tax=Boothiomyces macroporosus TaxID=261099 RepID=A0AAD5ULZ5_9FUNG|nr:hypothetical protein HK103_004674 [Boothiomyces macroporosus]
MKQQLQIQIPKERVYTMQDYTIEPVTLRDLNFAKPKKTLKLLIPKEREYFIEEKIREPFSFEELIANATIKRKDSGCATESNNFLTSDGSHAKNLRVTIPEVVYQPEDNLDFIDYGDQWLEKAGEKCSDSSTNWAINMLSFSRNRIPSSEAH